jgi:two-component system sensor histidine kinase KdpD
MTRDLASAVSKKSVLKTGIQHMCEVFGCRAAVFTIGKKQSNKANYELTLEKNLEPSYDVNTDEFGVAQWVLTMQQVAGAGTATLPGARAIYFPLTGANDPVGVLGILPKNIQMDVDERHLLETFVRQIALALERAKLSQELADATGAHEIIGSENEIANLG